MPTENLIPNAAGTYENIANSTSGVGKHWQDVDDPIGTPDDNDTRVNTGNDGVGQIDTYSLPNHSEGSGTINSVTLHFRAKKDYVGAAKARAVIRTHASQHYGDQEAITTSYANYSNAWVVNPATSDPWTWDEVDDLEAGVTLEADASTWSYCTQVYVVVDYTPAPGRVRGYIIG
uniref:Tail protein n=1 Tax=viral metagenome TaxID=1070528 RepID=A0A6M3L0S1_9ZZZZ